MGTQLAGKTALVTGSSRGIGRAIALELAKEGARVAVHCKAGLDAAKAVALEIESKGGKALVLQGDVSQGLECRRIVSEAVAAFGQLDILVNNAGITRDKTLRKMGAADWDDVIATNLSSAFHCTQAALEGMVARGFGRVVNVSSIIGQTGAIGQSNYAAAKAGLIAFTKSVSLEVAKSGVTVNAVCPGFIDTDMVANVPQPVREKIVARIPMLRFGTADEVGKLVRFLCAEGEWITGAQLNVNGGQYL